MKEKENNKEKLEVDGKPIPVHKKPFKKKFYPKKTNWVVIANLVLKVIEVSTLIAIWYELFLNNSIFD